MGALKSLAMAFSCFSRIPMPHLEWDERNMRFMMAFFPVVGLVIGAVVTAWCMLADASGIDSLLRGAVIALAPVALTGGIHLDGFADVIDALSSHADLERKRIILKDPHIGAFAAIGVASYLILYVALASEVPSGWRIAVGIGLVQVLVRCLSGIATVALAGAEEGMLAAFRKSADKAKTLVALVLELAVSGAAIIVLLPLPGALAVAVGLIGLVLLIPFAHRQFGGMSGDVAGFFLTACEVAMVACLAIASKAMGL